MFVPPTAQPTWNNALFGTTMLVLETVVVAVIPVKFRQLNKAAKVVRDTVAPFAARYPVGTVMPA